EGGTMCPSYMVTREEMHSTRGRARLLWEMLNGAELNQKGWRDEHVHEALDLCLACKGCKADCPVNVDMATYKAEFLSHYHHGRLPRSKMDASFSGRTPSIISFTPRRRKRRWKSLRTPASTSRFLVSIFAAAGLYMITECWTQLGAGLGRFCVS